MAGTEEALVKCLLHKCMKSMSLKLLLMSRLELQPRGIPGRCIMSIHVFNKHLSLVGKREQGSEGEPKLGESLRIKL